MHTTVLSIYIQEFNGSKSVKFVKHEIPDGFGTVLEDFEEQLDKVDFKKIFGNMVEASKLESPRWKKKIGENGKQMELRDWYKVQMKNWLVLFLDDLDNLLESKVAGAVLESSKSRCSINGTVYDFTSDGVDDNLKKVLGLGGNYVTHNDDMDEVEARKKLERELLDYVQKYRRFIEHKAPITECVLDDWLTVAIRTSIDEHHKFYKTMREYKLIGCSRRRFNENENYDFKKLDKENKVIVDCDKNCGTAILDLKDMIQADETMVNELKGTKCNGQDKDEVKDSINEAIKEFEKNLCPYGRKYLGTYYSERQGDPEETDLPFLKLKAKVHKLNAQQLKERKVESLKFRPVIDSSRTPLHYYSKAIRDFTLELTRKLVEKHFPGQSPLVKNGQQIAEFLESLKNEENCGTYLAISDLSSAYSYIYLENLKYAINMASRELEIPSWKTRMFIKMAELVLENSFVQTSGGIYKLGSCLPMGLGMSGESLDLVCLVCEINLFGKVIAPELSRCSEKYPDWVLEDEGKLMEAVIQYFRYRDDTFTYAKAKAERDLTKTVYALGSGFLSTLDLNVNISHFVGSYLDCFFYKKLSGFGFVTLVRRKGHYPVSFQHSSSNFGEGVVKSVISGEILRHRRLCSTDLLVEINDTCLRNELESRGYIREYVANQIMHRIKKIQSDYDKQMKRKHENVIPKNLVYGSTCKYDATWHTHHALRKLLRKGLPSGVKLPMIIPGTRLRTKYYTKKRFLNMASKWLMN